MFINDLIVPPELQPHTVKAERKGHVGHDTAGKAAQGWTVTYKKISCAVDLHPAGEQLTHGQPVSEYQGNVYIGLQADGSFPTDIKAEDRMTFGTWPDGQTRYLIVQESVNELEKGVVMVCAVKARKPG